MYLYNLGQKFDTVVKNNPNKTAIIFSDDSGISFEELNRLSNRIAHFLTAKGLVKQQVVAIQNDKTPFGFASMIACLKLGIIYVNFDFLNPKERIQKIFQTAVPQLVITDCPVNENVLKVCNELGIEYIDYSDKTVRTEIDKQDVELSESFIRNVSGQIPAYIMFTSGSTGVPKGVLIKQESVLNLIEWGKDTYQLTEDDIMTNVNPIYFDNSVFDFYCSVFNGITMVAISKEITGQPKKMLEIIDRYRCTFWFSVPSMLIYLMNIRLLNDRVLRSIRTFSFGGEGYPKELLIKLHRLYKKHAKFYNVYGPTEGTCICSAYEIHEEDFNDMGGLITLGNIAPNFEYKILNIDGKSAEIGELCLLGTQLALGYYNDFERTKKSFVRDTTNSGYNQVMYKTGDLVEEKNGKLYFLGRVDNQIKHMGYRIELEEIEAGLIKLPYIKQCAVIHGKTAAGFSKLVAFVATDIEVDEKSMREDLREYLPNYMIPNIFKLVVELPKNANGKVDRVLLKKLAELE